MTEGHQLRLFNSLGRRIEDFVPAGATTEALRDSRLTAQGQRVVIAAADALLGLELATLQLADVDQRRTVADLSAAEAEEIEQLVADRTAARADRDWARADEIRAELDKRGVQVTDTPQGAVWQLA